MTLQALDFGVVGDGETDNTVALIALRDVIRTSNRRWIVEFEPGGHYTYTDNRWLSFGNSTVILDFNGSRLEVTAVGVPILPLGLGPLVLKPDYPAKETDTGFPGHLIGPARPGDIAIKLLDPIAAQFPAGTGLLIAANIQQTTEDGTEGWGWPPNFERFGFYAVAAVVDDHTLRLSEPLREGYDPEKHKDLPQSSFGAHPYGAPRIWRTTHLDGRQFPRSLTIRNANFAPNRNRLPGNASSLPLSGLYMRLENCATVEGVHVYPTMAKRVELVDCLIWSLELDKIVECVLMEHCTIYGQNDDGTSVHSGGDGGGVLDLHMSNCTLHTFFKNKARRALCMKNVRFTNSLMFHQGVTPGSSITMNCTMAEA